MTTERRVRPATDEVFRLAEGPVWDSSRGRLHWVDIEAGAVLAGVLDDERIQVLSRTSFDGMVGAVVVAEDGTRLVAAQEHLVVLRSDGSREDGPRIVPAGQDRRLNDGGSDPAGRFLIGSMSLAGASEREVLARWELDGAVTTLDDDLGLSNGLAWSADGRRLFSVDTQRQTVFVRDYDPGTGGVGERRVHLQVAEGSPDGMAMDAEDHLWVAIHGQGEVRRFAPDGALVDRLGVAAPLTTSVAFAGADLQSLVVTTATSGLSDEQRRAFPDSGRLFTARVDVPGVPVPYWRPPRPTSR